MPIRRPEGFAFPWVVRCSVRNACRSVQSTRYRIWCVWLSIQHGPRHSIGSFFDPAIIEKLAFAGHLSCCGCFVRSVLASVVTEDEPASGSYPNLGCIDKSEAIPRTFPSLSKYRLISSNRDPKVRFYYDGSGFGLTSLLLSLVWQKMFCWN